MKIDCEMTREEFIWMCTNALKSEAAGYEVQRVYRTDDGEISIKLKPIVLSDGIVKTFKPLF